MTGLRDRVSRALSALAALRRIAPAPLPAAAASLVEYAVLHTRLRRAHVQGFCPLPHGLVLFWLARFGGAPGPVVEVGSAWGLSTIVLARGSRGRVVTVDTHEGQGMSEPEDSFEAFQANVARLGVAERVDAHRMTSHELASRYDGESAALLYVDGLHTYDGVSSDIDDWLPHVAAGGFVVFDDYGDPDFQVREAVDDAAAAGRLSSVERLYGLAVARPG